VAEKSNQLADVSNELEKIKSDMEERAATISGKFSFLISTFIFFRQQTSRAGEKSESRARKRNL
jgi:hypothetical protein